MKNFVMLILAVIAVWFVWHIIMGLFASVIHIAILIGMIALFVWLVSSVYKALTREKVKY